MARILVTGACGFVGPSVCNLGVLMGHDVFATDIGTLYKEYLSPKVNLRLGIDIRALDPIAAYVQEIQPDIILHIAAYFKYHGPWSVYEAINVMGTKHVLLGALKVPNLKRVVVWSSGSVLGATFKGAGPLDEKAPAKPRSRYELSKLLAEEVALQFSDKLPVTVIRPAAIYGSGIEYGGPAGTYGALKVIQMLFKNQLNGIPGNGKNRISFIHVEDIARIAYFLAGEKEAEGEVYNTTDASEYTLGELICHVAGWLRGHKIPINFYPRLHIPLPVIYLLGLWCETLAKWQKKEPAVERPFLNFFRPGYHFLMSHEKLDRLIAKTEGKRPLPGPVMKYRDILKDGGMDHNLEWYQKEMSCF